jgi:hypothetical protein
MTDITFIQTADPVFYYPMLHQTSRTVRQFCIRNGFKYESFVGVKRGHMAWQSTYNRVYMLKEMLDRGVRGWVYYLDADAFIGDMDFDVRHYLSDKGQYAGIFSGFCASEHGYDINAGGFALNLSHAVAHDLIQKYWRRVEDIPDQDFLHATIWSQSIPDDQWILYDILRDMVETRGLGDSFVFEVANSGYTNHGPFIRQRLRSKSPDFQTRYADIKAEVDGIMRGRRDARADVGPGYYFRAGHPRLRTAVGNKQFSAIRSTGRPGTLVYGPYMPLKAGNYFARVFGEARPSRNGAPIRVASDVVSDEATVTWAKGDETLTAPTKGLLVEHRFSLPRDVDQTEVRVSIDEHQDIDIHAVQIHWTDQWVKED